MITRKLSEFLQDNLSSELIIWGVIATLCSGRPLLVVLQSGFYYFLYTGGIHRYYLDILFGALVFLIPLLFSQIFGVYPLQALRNYASREPLPIYGTLGGSDTRGFVPGVDSPECKTEATGTICDSRLYLLREYAKSSAALAERIYKRSGVYLLVGVLIAFLGVAFFFIQTSTSPLQNTNSNNAVVTSSNSTSKNTYTHIPDLSETIINLAPRFGVLFFIEVIAFFFLRQYRAAMDEFRYYESVQRKREEFYALVRLSMESKIKVDPFVATASPHYYSGDDHLKQGETTELLEAKKAEGSELDLIGKIIDVCKKSKGA